jgi:hypothetical protein
MNSFKKLIRDCVIAGLAIAGLNAPAITLTPIASGFNGPIGIDYQPSSGQLILSVNFDANANNLDIVSTGGSHTQFSALTGYGGELKVCTAKTTANGFTAGEVFTGKGPLYPGEIIRISANGSTIQNPWVTLLNETGYVRSQFIDNTGVFGGALIVVTSTGGVWKVTSAGVATKLTDLGTDLEGVITVPNTQQYGPWAGKILTGGKNSGYCYTVSTTGATVSYSGNGITFEDFDLVPANQNFYGIAYSDGQILTAPASDFTSVVGDILVTDEYGALRTVRWNGSSFVFTALANSTPAQWEHVTFAPIQVVTLHLQSGSFPSSGTFQFTVTGPSSQTATLEGSTDLISWSYLADITFDANNSYTHPDPSVSGVAYKYYRASLGSFHSDNIYGFDRFTAPAGDSLIASPLSASANTAAGVIPNPPVGTKLYKWNEGTSQYEINTYGTADTGGYAWSVPGMSLAPGEGAILRTPTGTAVPLSFIGNVLQGSLNISMPALPAKSIRSSKVPQAGSLQSLLGFAPVQNDTIYRMTPGAGTYTTYTYANGAWTPSQPTINVGESFWIYTSTARTWSRTFSGW